MATWPTTLPAYIDQEGYNETPQDPVLRTSNDTGPAKSRLRYTAIATPFTGSIKITGAQKAILDAFWKSDCAYGAVSFNWVRPVEQTACVMKWKAPPSYASNGAGFVASLQLEIQP